MTKIPGTYRTGNKPAEVVSILDWDGVDSTGNNDNTTQFNEALTQAGEVGSLLQVPGGLYATGPLFIKKNSGIEGAAWQTGAITGGTELFLIDGANADHINFLDPPSRYGQLRNLSLSGNSANQTGSSNGVNLVRTSANGFTTGDSFYLANLFIKDYLSSGVNLGGFCNGTTLLRVYSNFNLGRGFNSFAGDIHYLNCEAFSNELAGFDDNGFGSMYSNCKSWFNGENGDPTGANRLPGFWFRPGARGIVAASCYAQENYGHGFWLDNCSGVNVQGSGDGNSITYSEGNIGPSTSRLFDGFHLEGAEDCTIMASCDQFQKSVDPSYNTQRYGIYLDTAAANNSVNAVVERHDKTATTGNFFYQARDVAGSSNTVVINGESLTTPAFVSTVANVSSSTAPNYGLTLLDSSSSFAQVTLPAGTVPAAGTTKSFRTIDATNSAQVIVQDYIDGTLTQPMNSVGDTLILISDGNAWNILVPVLGSSISDPSGGGTVDTEARTAINALIDRLEDAGIIAT